MRTLPDNFIPRLPFPNFKWKWASLQCTEGINDPVVLLGVLFRMRKLELQNNGVTFSSEAFAQELASLDEAIKGRGVNVDLAHRVGDRNLMRNSGQYWRAVGLLPSGTHGGKIELTPFGRQVADRKISQTEFAVITIQTLSLPNANIQSEDECKMWRDSQLAIRPLLLILKIMLALSDAFMDGQLSKYELIKIVIPLSGVPGVTIDDYVYFISQYRLGRLSVAAWPNCVPAANDHRIATEFLLFLENYGYIERSGTASDRPTFHLAGNLFDEIRTIVVNADAGQGDAMMNQIQQNSELVQEIERKRVQCARYRPNQARFRKAVLGDHPRCVITNVTMSEVLEAAHIVPFKYQGEDTVANGFCMRMDIHQLFDSGHLRINVDGEVRLSDRARMEYGATIPPVIRLSDHINRDFVKWRWENYNGM